ncbi:MAG: DUF6651 domain-containing protein [Moraxellaceae bacterium]
MKLKLDENGHVVVQDGKPVYVHADGKELAFDAAHALEKIGTLNREAQGHREAKESAEGKLKAFEGIEDAAAARKALETVKNLDQKKLVDAGEVEKVKLEAIKALEEQYAPVVKKAQDLEQQLIGEKIGGSFSRSKFIAEKLAIPADMAQAAFGSAFKLEDGRVVAYQGGNKIFSRAKPGELADFDEALETLISSYPHRDSILKGSGASGGGANQGGQGGGGGKKTMQRTAFDAMAPTEKAAFAKDGGVVTD